MLENTNLQEFLDLNYWLNPDVEMDSSNRGKTQAVSRVSAKGKCMTNGQRVSPLVTRGRPGGKAAAW